ncbi:MAG: Thiol-disulfide oxidoreductase ResA [Anaerolineae bacterium]|nr:Thiol-disulfide oxidoreductase ResA [Anaerolineae bacterium]
MTLSQFINNKRLQSVVVIVVVALAALVGLMLLMSWLASPDTSTEVPEPVSQPAETNNRPATPAPTPTDEIVATVNDVNISRQMWQKAAQLDAVMSKLAHQPVPTAEETLDRLVNEILVLEQQPDVPAPLAAEVSARIDTLSAAWNVSAPALETALAEANLTQADLTARMSRLLQVESALGRVSQQGTDLNQWLAQARASAEIGVYRALANVASTPPAVENSPPTAVPAASVAETQPAPAAPPPDVPVGSDPGNAAPDFSLPLLNGGTLALNELRGKPAIINFWATWCPPCRRELPALQAAYETYGDRIGFVAVDVKEQPEQVAGFVNELGITFPIVLDGDGAVSGVAYKVRGIPTTVFVDANGVISARHVGPLDETTINSYLAPLLEPMAATVEMPPAESQAEPGAQPAVSAQSEAGLPVAPDFTLPSATGDPVALADYQDKSTLVLVFYRGHT